MRVQRAGGRARTRWACLRREGWGWQFLTREGAEKRVAMLSSMSITKLGVSLSSHFRQRRPPHFPLSATVERVYLGVKCVGRRAAVLYSLMGQQTSREVQGGLRGKALTMRQVGLRYQKKLFLKSKKSSTQFQQELESICKRTAYLKYGWANVIAHLPAQDDRLYSEYQSVLRQNCLREGRGQKPFCPGQVQKLFVRTFLERYGSTQKPLTPSELLEAFDECKSYFMVMAWLHRLVSLPSEDQQNMTPNSNEMIYDGQEGQVYECLSQITTRTFQHYLPSVSIAPRNNSQIVVLPAHGQLVRMLRGLGRRGDFHEKEKIIGRVQEMMKKDEEKNNLVEGVLEMVGEARILGQLMVVRELGRLNIDYLWKLFGQGPYRRLYPS